LVALIKPTVVGVSVPTPNAPDTYVVVPLTLSVPSIVVVPFELMVKIGIPEASATLNMSPVKLSVTENNCPCEPCISKTIEPDL